MAAVKVIWAAKFYYPVGSGFKGHSHEELQLFYMASGSGRIVIGGEECLIGENSMAIVQKNRYHCLQPVEAGAMKLFDLKFTLTGDTLLQKFEALPEVLDLGDTPVRGYLTALRDEFRNKRPLYNSVADSIAEALLWELARQSGRRGAFSPAPIPAELSSDFTGFARKVADFINENYGSDLTNDRIADALGYNKNYCCMAFREGSGGTIGEYVNRVRIHHAVNAILYSDHSFAQIAQEVGFKNVYHFSRVFKRITGQTPSTVRELERDGLYHDHMIELLNPYRFDGGAT